MLDSNRSFDKLRMTKSLQKCINSIDTTLSFRALSCCAASIEVETTRSVIANRPTGGVAISAVPNAPRGMFAGAESAAVACAPSQWPSGPFSFFADKCMCFLGGAERLRQSRSARLVAMVCFLGENAWNPGSLIKKAIPGSHWRLPKHIAAYKAWGRDALS